MFQVVEMKCDFTGLPEKAAIPAVERVYKSNLKRTAAQELADRLNDKQGNAKGDVFLSYLVKPIT